MLQELNRYRGVTLLGENAVKTKVMGALAVVIALVAILIAVGIPAAASIAVPGGNAVVAAAGFLEVFLLLWMVKQF
jgi:hypothetical protein